MKPIYQDAILVERGEREGSTSGIITPTENKTRSEPLLLWKCTSHCTETDEATRPQVRTAGARSTSGTTEESLAQSQTKGSLRVNNPTASPRARSYICHRLDKPPTWIEQEINAHPPWNTTETRLLLTHRCR